MKKIKYLVIEGNIGSGKTTAAEALSSYLNADLVLETFENNPFLEKFYKKEAVNPLRMETHFLTERFFQLSEYFAQPRGLTISDYHFKKCLVFSGVNLSRNKEKLFYKLWKVLNDRLAKPELTVYLDSKTVQLKENIGLRGRAIEKELSTTYLEKIAKRYEEHLIQDPTIDHCTLDGSAFLVLPPKELAEALILALEENGRVLVGN